MNRRTTARGSFADSAFTLIELLVVIAIIGILAGIIAPGVRMAQSAARQQTAMGEVRALEFAFLAYQDEYKRVLRVSPTGVFPNPQVEADRPFIEVGGQVLRVLQGENIQTNNPRRRVFLQVKADKIQDGEFLDPWGNPYRYMLDFDYDGSVRVGEFGTNLLGRRAAVWSRGPEVNGGFPHPVVSW